ncbi:MAG: SixA phosphatase family protein [Candidatus Azotimanducaceae bacterium WSBS_2022_MAG_OTU7]
MKLLLMRHGEAAPNARTDADRPLTPYGREQVLAVARRLSDIHPQVEKSMVSPFLRARQTAAIMSGTFFGTHQQLWPEQVSDAITPDQSPERAALAIADCFESINTGLVVMHEPIISRLVYYLTGYDQPMMDTASLAIIEAPKIALGCCELECVI